MSLHRQSARRLSRAAQIIALLALAFLAVVIVAPRSEIKAPVVELPSAPTTSGAKDGQPSEANDPTPVHPQDWTTLSAALNASRDPIAGSTAIATTNPSGTTTVAANNGDTNSDYPDEPRPQPAPPGWKYLGYAQSSDGLLSALVTINNIQRFVHAGMQFDAYLISRITRSHVLLERDNQRFEVVRSEPAPFSSSASMASTPPFPGSDSARSRNLILEEQRLQAEEERNRRLRESGQAGAGGTQSP